MTSKYQRGKCICEVPKRNCMSMYEYSALDPQQNNTLLCGEVTRSHGNAFVDGCICKDVQTSILACGAT